MAHTDIKEVVRGLHGCSTGRVGSTVQYRDCVERGCMQTMNNQRTISNRPRCKQKFRCYEAKIEESEKAGSRQESNPGHLACAASALPLSYDNRTTTSPHNPLYVLHRWD